MKANSIDEIREHLAKGGRVKHVKGQATLTMPKEVDYYNLEPEEWQLLPLEEKEPVAAAMAYDQVCEALKEKRRVRFFWRDFPDRSFIVPSVFGKDGIVVCNEHDCSNQWTVYWGWVTERGYCQAEEPVDHGTINPCPFCGGEAKATVYSGNDAIFCSRCPAMMGGEESVATEEELAKAWNARVDHGTQKGQEERFRDSQKERMQRIRTRLLHGMWPEMQDLLAWWEATTGERIEWGRRCERCDGTGSRGYSSHFNFTRPTTIVMEHPRDTFVAQDDGKFKLQCGVCQGSGYSVRPTWMGDSK